MLKTPTAWLSPSYAKSADPHQAESSSKRFHSVIGIALFYGFALTTVVRSRFSTLTIGREYLVGKIGTAETDFDPEGVVVVDGARWRARSHRAAGLGPGDPIQVMEVSGILLEVGPPE